jgi:TPR repeat protein
MEYEHPVAVWLQLCSSLCKVQRRHHRRLIARPDDESKQKMGTLNRLLRVLGFAAFLAVSASAQTLNSGLPLDKVDPQLAAINKKALAGDPRAQLLLGIAFEFGQGVERSLDEAMRWYHLAADRGDAEAQTNLAYLYETGGNGPENPEEAAKWYLRAAVSGFARAKFNLGTLYLRGIGVERSDEDAAHWIGEAADAGCPTAVAALGYLYANGKGVPRDEQKARELIQKAAKKNDPRLCASFRGPTS